MGNNYGYAVVDHNGTVYGVGASEDLARRDAEDQAASRDVDLSATQVCWATLAAVACIELNGYDRTAVTLERTNAVDILMLTGEAL
jgi:hypothetical protein